MSRLGAPHEKCCPSTLTNLIKQDAAYNIEHRDDYAGQEVEKGQEVEVARTFDPKFAARTRVKVCVSGRSVPTMHGG